MTSAVDIPIANLIAADHSKVVDLIHAAVKKYSDPTTVMRVLQDVVDGRTKIVHNVTINAITVDVLKFMIDTGIARKLADVLPSVEKTTESWFKCCANA